MEADKHQYSQEIPSKGAWQMSHSTTSCDGASGYSQLQRSKLVQV